MTTWPPAQVIESRRVQLVPVAVSDAAEMVPVLADPVLYEFIGGRPPTLEQLERRYAAQSVGHSEDRAQWWLNWVVRLGESREAVGYVQATVEDDRSTLEASIAWVIAPQFQRRGLGSEATSAMVDWLRNAGVTRFAASIHPHHDASAALARHQGFRPTGTIDDDGEVRWLDGLVNLDET